MPEYYDILIKLVLSALLGGMIGYEREMHGSAAGLRTHILVSAGSCLIMLTSTYIFELYKNVASCDPARIAAGVVTGIGFLGAGTIMRYRTSVMGLTTAASVWVVSAIGLGVGSGFFSGSIMTTFLVILTLVIIHKWEHTVMRRDRYKVLIMDAKIDANTLQSIKNIFSEYMGEIRDFEIEKIANTDSTRLRFDIKLTSNKYDDSIIVELLKLEGISRAHWE